MTIFLNVVFLILGIGLLIKGADFFVESSSSIAKKLKIPAIIIGLTIVSFGTSAPELAVSISAAIQSNIEGTTADIAMGNIVGSNLFNLLVVLGFSSIFAPTIVSRGILKKEFPFLIMTTFILIFFSFDILLGAGLVNQIVKGEALTLLVLLALFMYIIIISALKPKESPTFEDEMNNIQVVDTIKVLKTSTSIIFLFIGLVGIIIGAEFVTKPATSLATMFATSIGIDKSTATTLVGLTVVAIGTSLPELVTSIVAAKKGENDIALGNILGSNVFNTVFIVGVSGTLCTLGINSAVLTDMLIMLGVTALVFILGISKNSISKKEGYFLISLYVVYTAYIVLRIFL